jgi:hypothetical protein
MRQIVTITNNGAPTKIDSVSLYTPAFEPRHLRTTSAATKRRRPTPDTGVVYATDGATTRFAAVGALTNEQFYMRYDVGEQFDLSTVAQDLQKRPGPFLADDIALAEMAVGLGTSGMVGTGESVVMEFAYLFALNLTEPPASFPAPAPASALLLVGALPVLVWSRRRGPRRSVG